MRAHLTDVVAEKTVLLEKSQKECQDVSRFVFRVEASCSSKDPLLPAESTRRPIGEDLADIVEGERKAQVRLEYLEVGC